MFCGNYPISIDEKGRIRIPAKFRAKLEGDIYICKGTDGCLFVLSESEVKEIFYDKTNSILLHQSEQQQRIRELTSCMQAVEEDQQGRFVLHSALKEYANIKKKTVFMGVLNRIEIWSEEKYNEKFVSNNIDIAEAVKELGL